MSNKPNERAKKVAKWRFIRFISVLIVLGGVVISVVASYFLVENALYRDWQKSPVRISALKWAPYRFGVFQTGFNTKMPELVYTYELQGKEYGHSTISLRNLFYRAFSQLPFVQQSKAYIDSKDPTHSVIVIAGSYTLMMVLALGIILVITGLSMYRKAGRLNKMNIIQHRFRGILKKEQRYGDHRTVS